MKRVLLLVLTLMVVFSLLVLPAFGSAVIRAHYADDHFESFTNFNSLIPSGEYNVTFYVTELDTTFDLGIHELTTVPYMETSDPNQPYKDAVVMELDYFTEDFEFYLEFVWNPIDGGYSLVDNFSELISYAAAIYVPEYTEYLDVVVELTPVPERQLTFWEALSNGVLLMISWLGEVAGLIVSSPVLLVLSVGFILVVFAVLLFKRF